uniref:TPT domain-containing protein n=2 Tax=Ascaris TaxID=6251 RepID=A0A0M3I0Q7_ASCLU
MRHKLQEDDERLLASEHDETVPPTSMSKILLMVMLYYPLSIGLTFYQKWFIKTYRLPLLIAACHYLVKYSMAVVVRCVLECVQGRRTRIGFREQLRWLAPIGICASFDIGLSNWALEYVTVSLYTMAKSSSILFIVAFALFLRIERWHPSLGVAAALIASGLFLFTWRSSQLDVRGLLLVELAAACTGVRWTVSQLVMQNEQKCSLRHPLDMVAHVQPWMLLAILPLVLIFERAQLSFQTIFFYEGIFAPFQIMLLITVGGLFAFSLEMSEYLLLLHTSGITLNIFGILKEVVTLLLAHFINGDHLTPINVFGLLLCLSGMSLHGASRHHKQNPRFANSLPTEAADRKSLLNDMET